MGIGLSFKSDTRIRACDAATERNPETGVIRGAEPLELGPQGAQGAVLFVHGFSGCPNNFNDLPYRVAAAGWRVKAMLLPGHGTSPLDFERTGADELLDAVKREAAGLRQEHERLVILGHSMGGALATLAAAEMKLDGLVLAAPYYAIKFNWYYLLPVEQWVKLLGPAVRWVYASADKQPVKRREVSREILSYLWIPTKAAAMAMGLAQRAAEPEAARRITCPSLLLHGKTDSVTSPEAAKAVFEAIPAPKKRAVWLDNSDHIIFWDYDREQVAKEVIGFLEDRAAG